MHFTFELTFQKFPYQQVIQVDVPQIEKFEKSARLFNKSRLARFMGAPLKLGYSKAIEVCTKINNQPLEVKATTFWGESFYVIFPEIVSMQIYRYGFFEEELTRVFLRYLKPGMTLFDVGSHFGYYSLLGAALVGSEGRVNAFEPTPRTFEMLKKNVAGRSNIMISNTAAFSTSAEMSFVDYGLAYSAFNSFYPGKTLPEMKPLAKPKYLNIKTVTIDEYISDKKIEPDFLKIDAEASEIDVLQGMENTLTRIKPIITIEVGDIKGPQGAILSKPAVEYILKKGYRCIELDQSKEMEHKVQNHYTYDNLLFLPN